jgi:ubiquinone/menaquinone biosynthesis C-methylase UbiE
MNPQAEAFKAQARAAWDQSAEGWHRHAPALRRWLHEATPAMLEMAGIGPGQRVLDVAAGAGDQTLDIARRVGPSGHVLATDLSPAILALAQESAARAGLSQVSTQVADGEELDVEPGSFDAAVCRLGLMLFPDPARAVRAMHRALRPHGGVCTMVFGRAERNPCITTVVRAAFEHAGLPPPDATKPGGLLSLGQPGMVDRLFESAGFRDVATTLVDAPFRLPTTHDYVEFVRSSASPIQQVLGRLDAAAQRRAWDDIEARLDRFMTSEGFVGPNELALTAGRR